MRIFNNNYIDIYTERARERAESSFYILNETNCCLTEHFVNFYRVFRLLPARFFHIFT